MASEQLSFKLNWLSYYFSQGFLVHAHHYRKVDGRCSCTDVPWNESKTCMQEVGGHPVRKYAEIADPVTAARQTHEQLVRDPGYNFALRTGRCSGVIAIDVDVKPGKNGAQSLDELVQRLGLHPDTFMNTAFAVTGSGGFHFLFAAPTDGEPIRNSQSALGPFLDVRGENGYILVAPSVHKRTGQAYRWEKFPDRANIQPLPQPLLSELRRTQGAASSTSAPAARIITPAPTELEFRNWAKILKSRPKTRTTGEVLVAALGGEPLPFPKGTGNEHFFKLARDIAEGWPSNNPAGIAELLRESVEKRQEQTGASTTVEELIGLIEREQLKIETEKTGHRWRYGKQGYERDKEGTPRNTVINYSIALSRHPEWVGVLGYDKRTHNIYYMKEPPFRIDHDDDSGPLYPREIGDTLPSIQKWLHTEESFSPANTGVVSEAVLLAAYENQFNPVREWIHSLPAWDGTPRIEGLLQRIGGVEDGDWPRIVQKRWFTSLVARMVKPGCKVDTMLILHGEQGFRKSSFFHALMPRDDWFSDSLRTPDSSEATIRQLHSGPVIFEIAEMQGFRRDAMANIKAFLSAKTDQIRPLYGKHMSAGRSCVVVGTTNDDRFLHDPTGDRRSWPLKIKQRIDIETLEKERVQLFAEAYHYYKAGHIWYLTPREEEIAKMVQTEHYDRHAWHDLISAWLSRRAEKHPQVASKIASPDYVDVDMIFDHVLDMTPKERSNPKFAHAVRDILRHEGWLPSRQPASRHRCYRRPGVVVPKGRPKNAG